MNNELIFFTHIFGNCIASIGALHSGKYVLMNVVILQSILANLFVTKQITLFGFDATPTDAFAVGIGFSLNLLQEYFGREAAKKTLYLSVFGVIYYLGACQFHLSYIPSLIDTQHEHFCSIFSSAPRIVIASISVFFFTQRFEIKLFSWLKTVMGHTSLLLRSGISLLICQFVDTLLFSFFGLYGIVGNIWHIILISYIIKVLVISFSSPFSWLCRYLIPTPS